MVNRERITIVIETGNAAFEDDPEGEVARILRDMADYLVMNGTLPIPRDINGAPWARRDRAVRLTLHPP
jgi:hypothetical protein